MKFSKLKDIIQTHPNPTSLSIKSCNGYRLDVYAPGHICNIWSGNSFDSLVCQLVFYRAIEVKDYVELYLTDPNGDRQHSTHKEHLLDNDLSVLA